MFEYSRAVNKRITPIWGVLLALVLSGSVNGQDLAERRPLLAASAFMQAIYPELVRTTTRAQVSFTIQLGVDVDESDIKNNIEITVWDEQLENRGAVPTETQATWPFLRAGMAFDRAGWVMNYGAEGCFLNARQNLAFAEISERHPQWTRSQLARALKQSGARYGPGEKAAFLRTVPFKALEKFLGKIRTVNTVRFSDDSPSAGGARWSVRLLAERPGEELADYFLVFEPFDGRLVQIGAMKQWPSVRSSPSSASQGLPSAIADPVSVSRGANSIQLFLASFYPELLTQKVDAILSAQERFDATWGQLHQVKFSLWDDPPSRGVPMDMHLYDERNPHGYEARLLMQGNFMLDEKGRVARFNARDSFVLNAGKNADLRAFLENKPGGRTTEQGLQLFQETGARYGPKDQEAFLKTIPLSLLERFLGKLRIESVKFDTMLPGGRPFPAVAFFQWHVVVQAERPGEPPTKYVLHFEPFGGKLTEIKAP